MLGGAPGEDPVGIAIRNNARLRLSALAQAGDYEVTVAHRFPLSAAADAHWLLAKGRGAGRMALVMDSDRSRGANDDRDIAAGAKLRAKGPNQTVPS